MRKVEESGNIHRVFLYAPLSRRLTNGTREEDRKMQSSFLFAREQTTLTLRARTRVHVISNGTIFLQPWFQMESVGQFRIAIELASSFFFSFIEFVLEECISLFKDILTKFVSINVTFLFNFVIVKVWILFSIYFLIIQTKCRIIKI